MLNIGDKILERGYKDVHIITMIIEADRMYYATRMKDDRERKIPFAIAVKTKKSPKLLIKSFGFEFETNISEVLRKKKLRFTLGHEDRREDIVRFFVEEKDFEQAKQAVDDYYKET